MFEKNIDSPEHVVRIKDLPKENVLAALYNRASPVYKGIFMYIPDKMDASKAFFVINFRGDDACYFAGENPKGDLKFLFGKAFRAARKDFQGSLRNELYFDYLFGRAMKVDISGECFSSKQYDEYNGRGSAQKAIDELMPEKVKV